MCNIQFAPLLSQPHTNTLGLMDYKVHVEKKVGEIRLTELESDDTLHITSINFVDYL